MFCYEHLGFHRRYTRKFQDINYQKDKDLNKLYENIRIEDTALSKIMTMGSSKYYVHESEVTSYRELILKQIQSQDRWRGYAWILQF